MSADKERVVVLTAAITGNVASQSMLNRKLNSRAFGSAGLDAGGRVDLGTATTADVVVKDTLGKVIYSATVTSDTDISPTAAGVQGPLKVTVTNISNSAHTLTVYWYVRK